MSKWILIGGIALVIACACWLCVDHLWPILLEMHGHHAKV